MSQAATTITRSFGGEWDTIRYVSARLDMPTATRFYHAGPIAKLGLTPESNHAAISAKVVEVCERARAIFTPLTTSDAHEKSWAILTKPVRRTAEDRAEARANRR